MCTDMCIVSSMPATVPVLPVGESMARINMCTDMSVNMFDMCRGMRVSMPAMCKDVCIDMCMKMFMDMCGHVYGHRYTHIMNKCIDTLVRHAQ